jgi:predicted transcriptional regulator
MLQAFQVTITEERTGPRGGKAKPVIRAYSVTAATPEEARALFIAEMGEHQVEGARVTVSACGCRVMPVPIGN